MAGLAVYYAALGEEPAPLLTEEARATRAVLAWIEAESRGTLREPEIQAPPRTADTLLAVKRSAEDPAPSPPDGYTFVSYHGEMPRVRIARDVDGGDKPPTPGPDWLDPAKSIETLATLASEAGRDWSFGWIGLAEDARPNQVAGPLADLGITTLGSSGNLIRARLPGDPALLHEIVALPEVDGLGAVPPVQKLPATFAGEVFASSPREQVPVFITLMADDPDGRWRSSLEDLGAVVGRFDPDIRVYTANVAYGRIEAVAAADYVLAVEPVGIVRTAHDTAVPAMGADALRWSRRSPGVFFGSAGSSVPIGVMDTGLNINHLDIVSNRDSICAANFVWNSRGGPDGTLQESEDLWIDAYGHGTHVTGTVAGNGTVQPRFAGMAPGVRHIRFAKVLAIGGGGSDVTIMPGMDFLAEATECAESDRPSFPAKPLIVNMSLAGASRGFHGRDSSARKLDSIVWGHRQLYVVAQQNAGINGFSQYGAAKSSLSVGAVLDSGDLASFSSHGPTFDGRLAPQIVGTGVQVRSARGGGSRGEYLPLGGTSMSSPAVAGVAALLMDAVPEYREQPALARARLMAGAIRPDPWLEVPDAFPSTNTGGPGSLQAQYGLGKVSARTTVLNRVRSDGWVGGGAVSELQEGEVAARDIEVPAGASRLDLVMTWDEPPAETIDSTVLNDLDLWLDRDGNCGEGACGEYVSASRVDNVEWIIVRNPRPGTYRAKLVAHRVYTAPPRAALAWTVIRGASTPNLEIDADRGSLPGDGEQELTLRVRADEYVAAGSRLHVDCRDMGEESGCDDIRIRILDVSREDGIPADLPDDVESPFAPGMPIPLGEIAAGETQEVRFAVSSEGDGEPVRLYFTASAWNATSASTSVDVAPTGTGNSELARRPANDDFASATTIRGEQGSQTVDLVLATPEPGEPVFTARRGRPAGSVWYRWTAPADGAIRFRLSSRSDRVDVFQGRRISALEPVASRDGGILFFAERGQSYRIRVSHFGRGVRLDLRWSQGSRPANDDFARAEVLEGEAGFVDGNSQGATLEPGEWFGRNAAGSTWYRWTAPEDGRWFFHSSHSDRLVLAFEGNGVDSLRLVSNYPGWQVSFPAGRGREYRIAVVERSADQSGGPYQLTWRPSDRYVPPNDDISGAEEMESAVSSEHVVDVDRNSTVAPEEPRETGVRTKWWMWEVPEREGGGDGPPNPFQPGQQSGSSYTWRLMDNGESTPTYPKLQVTAFTGPSPDELKLMALTGTDMAPSDFVVSAEAGQRVWIAAGFRTGDIAAYSRSYASARLLWGPTPVNDNLAGAETLAGTAGSVSGSNRFATAERGERGSALGHSSLWWTYRAPATGWHRFWLEESEGPWVLTLYREGGDGFGGLEFVRSSHPPEGVESEAIEVIFHAERGARHTIRLGSRGRIGDGEFTIHWGETEPPVWLRYAGGLADGDRDADGSSVQLEGPLSLEFNDRGTALYAASKLGLQVFERDPETGDLTFRQLLDDDSLENSSLIWDPHRRELYAHRCGTWFRFAPRDETRRELAGEGRFPITGDPISTNCSDDVFMDSGGSFLHAVLPGHGLQILDLDTAGELRHVMTREIPNLKRAVISHSGGHIYAITDGSLRVIERDADSGRPLLDKYHESLRWRGEALAISSDDHYLFVFDEEGFRTNVYGLEKDPSNPHSLGTLQRFWGQYWLYYDWRDRCRFAVSRRGIPAVDVFCSNLAFGIQWQEEVDSLAATDFVAPWQTDRYNQQIPEFSHVRSVAASPDGRHAYLDTEQEGLVIFERVGAGEQDHASQGRFSVARGNVTVGSISSEGCIAVEDVVRSIWQTRASPNLEWADISDTETAGQLCAYTPTDAGEFRLAADIGIDGQLGRYLSNTIR